MATHSKLDTQGSASTSYGSTSGMAFGATVNPNTLTSVFDPRLTFPSSSLTNGTDIEARNNVDVKDSSGGLPSPPGLELELDTKMEMLVDEDESMMQHFDPSFYSTMNTNTHTTSSNTDQQYCQSPRSLSIPEAQWIPSMPRRDSNSISVHHASVDSISSVESMLQQQGSAPSSSLPYNFQAGWPQSAYPSVPTVNIFGGGSDYPDPATMREMYGAGFPVMYDQQVFATFSPDLALQSSQRLPMDMSNTSRMMMNANDYSPNMFDMSNGFSPVTGAATMPVTGTTSVARKSPSSKGKSMIQSLNAEHPSMKGHGMIPMKADGCNSKKKATKSQKNKQAKQKSKKHLNNDQPPFPVTRLPIISMGIRTPSPSPPPPATVRPAKKPAVEFIDDPTSNSSKKNKSKRKEMNRVAARRHREKMKEKLRDYEEKRLQSDRTIEEGNAIIQSLRITVETLQREIHLLRNE